MITYWVFVHWHKRGVIERVLVTLTMMQLRQLVCRSSMHVFRLILLLFGAIAQLFAGTRANQVLRVDNRAEVYC